MIYFYILISIKKKEKNIKNYLLRTHQYMTKKEIDNYYDKFYKK